MVLSTRLWLSLMRDRLEILRRLLREDGSIWITIDDNECHYLKVMWTRFSGERTSSRMSSGRRSFRRRTLPVTSPICTTTYLLFAKDKEKWTRNLLPRSVEHDKNYKNPDNDPRGPWTSGDLSARNFYGAGTYHDHHSEGSNHLPAAEGHVLAVLKRQFVETGPRQPHLVGKDGDNQPRIKRFLSEVMEGIVPQTIWFQQEVGNTQEAKKEIIAVVPEVPDAFETTETGTPPQTHLRNRQRTLATGSSTPSPVPARPVQWRIRWGDGGSWSSWANTATRTSSRD